MSKKVNFCLEKEDKTFMCLKKKHKMKLITDELSCDILAVNISDKRYDASDNECYKIKLISSFSKIQLCQRLK